VIVHIFDDTPHHYIPMSGFFNESCTIKQPQQFWVKAGGNTGRVADNFQPYRNADDLVTRLKTLPEDANIVFHGLFDIHVWRKLWFTSLLRRCNCVFWGAELYRHGKPNRTIKQHVAQWLHAIFIYRCANVFTLNSGDASLAKLYLKRKQVQVLPYPIIGVDVDSLTKAQRKENGSIKILVGNSAAASNEHVDIFKRLSHLANEDIEVIVPLNYAGTSEYVNNVVSAGKAIFGDKLAAITDMLEKSAYDQLLADVDLTVFAHQRQQGLYVVYAMLLMGKPMLLRESTSSYRNLTSLGFSLYGLEGLEQIDFETLTAMVKERRQHNIDLMKETYTEQALAPKWSEMVNSLGAM